MLKLRNVVQVDEIQHLLNLDHFFSYPGRLFFWGMKSCFVLFNVQYYSAIIPCSSHCTVWSVLLLSNHHSLSPNATHWIVETSLHTPWRCSDKDHLLQHDIVRVMADQSRALGYMCRAHCSWSEFLHSLKVVAYGCVAKDQDTICNYSNPTNIATKLKYRGKPKGQQMLRIKSMQGLVQPVLCNWLRYSYTRARQPPFLTILTSLFSVY